MVVGTVVGAVVGFGVAVGAVVGFGVVVGTVVGAVVGFGVAVGAVVGFGVAVGAVVGSGVVSTIVKDAVRKPVKLPLPTMVMLAWPGFTFSVKVSV